MDVLDDRPPGGRDQDPRAASATRPSTSRSTSTCSTRRYAPGTGTPEAGGLTSRELLGILRGLAGVNLVGADIVEVAPPYDHAEITAIAASHAAYELLALFARKASPADPRPSLS